MLKIKSSQNHSQYRRKFMFKILIFQSKELILRNNPAQSLSFVQVFVDPWTIACQASGSMGTLQATILEWAAIPSSRGSFPIQGLNPGLPHCRQILYRLNHQGSPRPTQKNRPIWNHILIKGTLMLYHKLSPDSKLITKTFVKKKSREHNLLQLFIIFRSLQI